MVALSSLADSFTADREPVGSLVGKVLIPDSMYPRASMNRERLQHRVFMDTVLEVGVSVDNASFRCIKDYFHKGEHVIDADLDVNGLTYRVREIPAVCLQIKPENESRQTLKGVKLCH